ncbi:MAG: hypothetical protein K9G70_11635 [Prolixibacteraceae bacterium]|nr:hypothetical protein [Prolixibacteraceae bacterium]
MKHIFLYFLLVVISASQLNASKLVDVKVIDKDYILVHFKDGDVEFADDASGSTAYGGHSHKAHLNWVVSYGNYLDTDAATDPANWNISSTVDPNYGESQIPFACYRKSKMNGMAEMEWNNNENDYRYEYTMEHSIYLQLPYSLEQGMNYSLTINTETNSDKLQIDFTYDIFKTRSEAIHVNLVGYNTVPSVKAADLYAWMGDGGARDYSSFEGNKVFIYNVETQNTEEVGSVKFWKKSAGEDQGYNFTQSDVWNIDFTGFNTPGTYRLAVEGVGCSQDFEIRNDIYKEPFRVSTLGFFYMRIGADGKHLEPVPRRPLWMPNEDPSNCKVLITSMHPWKSAWGNGGDRWDQPDFFANYVLPGRPENPNAYGGHSDALDWDRHLGHVSIIWDMLLPYILTNGAMDDDDIGILESGNSIPDIIDEARDEVDFFLSLRNGRGYSHGLSNPDKNNILYQAGNTPLAAWASAVNSAMLAEAFRISGHADLMKEYTDSALVAFNYANALSDPWLGYKLSIGEGLIKGRDLKMTAAAFLYNLTGYTEYEDIMHKYNVVSSSASSVMDFSFNQLYAASAYLTTPRTVNYPDMHSNMKASVIRDAKIREANYSAKRPSRRSVDNGNGYFHTVQNVYRTILAHAIADNQQEKDYFLNTMTLEADWGLGRNPLNMIQMTTATTPLAAKRSVENCYTSGRNDGSPGLHPGHTPYLNMDGWACGMTMGCPPSLHKMSYPKGVDTWPRGELYFNTRYVWAHSEFTPHQTMRGKQALYGYLYGHSKQKVAVADSTHSSTDPYDEYYNIMGRSDLDVDGGPVLFYAGSSIRVRFEGTSVSAGYKDYNSRKNQKIGFIIDQGSPVVRSLEKNSSNTIKIAENLNDSIHELIIYKMEGPGAGVFGLQFKGLKLDEGKGILPVKTKTAYKLEFYGDSFTAGGGADCTGDNGDCGQNNGFNSYANVCARLINAEVYNNGISGLSVMDDTGWYQSKTTGLQSTYNKLDPSTENASGFTEWDFNRYTPGIVVFGFGINDSYGGGDPFGNPDQWKEAYKEIVKNVVDN